MLAWWRRRRERRRWAARAAAALRRQGESGADGETVALIIGVTIMEANAQLGPLRILPAEEVAEEVFH
jgi:hypothetical protein